MPTKQDHNTSTPPDLARLVSLSAAAEILGVSERWLRAWCAGAGTCTPAMPHARRGLAYLVDPAQAHAHIQAHARRMPRKFQAPGLKDPGGAANVSTTSPNHLVSEAALSAATLPTLALALTTIAAEIRRRTG